MGRLAVYETSRGFVLARERDGQFHAPMTPEAAKATGAHTVFGRDIEDVAKSPNIRKYKREADARKALQRMLDGDVDLPRGRRRPPLNPDGGVTTPLRIRLADRQLAELEQLVDDGHGPTTSDAVRYLIDESAKKRRGS